MGLFDSVYFLDNHPRCAAGHALDGELQTKDLRPAQRTFYVSGGKFWLVTGKGRWRRRVEVVDGTPRIVDERVAAPALEISGEVDLFTECQKCQPVLYERRCGEPMGAWGQDHVGEVYPKACQRAVIVNGVVTALAPDERSYQTRADVQREWAELGHEVIPDDDRVARKHFALLAERGQEDVE